MLGKTLPGNYIVGKFAVQNKPFCHPKPGFHKALQQPYNKSILYANHRIHTTATTMKTIGLN